MSVAGNGGSIQVLTDDGRQATAKIVGIDEPDDLAVIKVDGLPNLTAATFAKSGNLVSGPGRRCGRRTARPVVEHRHRRAS